MENGMGYYLSGLLGSKAKECVLMYLFARGKGYVSEIADFFPDVSRNAIQNAAEVLEKDGVLVEGQQGNMRVYEFSSRCPYADPLQHLLQAISKCYSPEERQRLFMYRGAPRRKGKVVTV
jgi:biotin operon repressor